MIAPNPPDGVPGSRPAGNEFTVTTPPAGLLAAAAKGPDSVKAYVRAAGGGPLQDGAGATFVWIGDAEAVALQHWMDVFPPLPGFHRIDHTPIWYLTIELPVGSRIEYKIAVRRSGRRHLLLDHLNPKRARDPFGSNSVVTGPGYRRPEWSLRSPGVPRGTVEPFELASTIYDAPRSGSFYVPPGSHRRLPLLVALDGSEYAEYAALTVTLDNLIAANVIPPVAVALCDPVDRFDEYTGSDTHSTHIVDEIVPAAAGGVGIDRNRVTLMGASLGAVAALHVAWRYPSSCRGLVLQSGSFVSRLGGRFRRGDTFRPVVEFMQEFMLRPGRLPDRIAMSCGRYDGLVGENRTMAAYLRSLGVDVDYEEALDGHNWENWRDRLQAGLAHVLAAPGH